MNWLAENPMESACSAFDDIAEHYDEMFTRSVIGRAQRQIVWEVLADAFSPGDRVLEINCGTGEDALFLARRGVSVEACDESKQMIQVAQRRQAIEAPELPISFQQLRTECIEQLLPTTPFDGALSNFSGLNCAEDLRKVASNLSALVRRGGQLVLCLSTRVCLWEIVWFSAHGEFRKACRRVRGSAIGRLGEYSVHVQYPTIRNIARAFRPWFKLGAVRAVGLLVPPSYLEFWAARHATIVSSLAGIDRRLGRFPVICGWGDHVLLQFERLRT